MVSMGGGTLAALLASAGCIVLGGMITMRAIDSTASDILLANASAVIAAWNASHAGFEAVLFHLDRAQGSIALRRSHQEELALPQTLGLETPTYTPHFYQGRSHGDWWPLATWSALEAPLGMRFVVQSARGGAQTLDLPPVPLGRRVKTHRPRKLCGRGPHPGIWQPELKACMGFEVLATVCVAVEQQPSATWRVARGCWCDAGGCNKMVQYQTVGASVKRRSRGVVEHVEPIHIGDISVELRFAKPIDPLLAGRQLVWSGAATASLNPQHRLAALVGGGYLILCGVALLIPAWHWPASPFAARRPGVPYE